MQNNYHQNRCQPQRKEEWKDETGCPCVLLFLGPQIRLLSCYWEAAFGQRVLLSYSPYLNKATTSLVPLYLWVDFFGINHLPRWCKQFSVFYRVLSSPFFEENSRSAQIKNSVTRSKLLYTKIVDELNTPAMQRAWWQGFYADHQEVSKCRTRGLKAPSSRTRRHQKYKKKVPIEFFRNWL